MAKVPRILAGSLEPSAEVLNKKSRTFVAILYQMDEIFQKNPFPKKKFSVRNFMPQEEIFCLREKFPVTGRNLLSQEEIYCHSPKFPATGRNFLSQEETSF